MALTVGGDHADQADGQGLARDAIVPGVLFRGRRDPHQRLALTGPSKRLDDGEAGGVDAPTKMALPLLQGGDQPTGGIAAVQQQQIVRSEVLERLE